MDTELKLFINKYQPIYFNDFGIDENIIDGKTNSPIKMKLNSNIILI